MIIDHNKPLVSIIVPCYNAAEYIEQALNSALNQTHDSCEVIVINDGSTDNSLDLISSFGADVRCITTKNRGAGAARNRGIKLARGSFIQFLDADDILDRYKIEYCLKAFEPDVGLVFSDYTYFYNHSSRAIPHAFKAMLVKPFRKRAPRWDTDAELVSILRLGIGTLLPLHKKEHLLRIGGFNEAFTILEDVELLVRLFLAGVKLKRIDKKLVRVRNHFSPERLRLSSQKDLMALQTIYSMHEQILEAGCLNGEVKSALADLMANHGRKLYMQGYQEEALAAFNQAYMLDDFPKPTGVPIYNQISKCFGLEKTEKLFAGFTKKS